MIPNLVLLNREISLLAFNQRVLAQANQPEVPLLERLNYLCIVSSNLDEFFEIRVAWLKNKARSHPNQPLNDGLTPTEILAQVTVCAHELIAAQYQLLNDRILPNLRQQGLVFLRRNEWNEAQKTWLKMQFEQEILPVITPVGLDSSQPFPSVLNKSLHFIVSVTGTDAFGRNSNVAIVQAPRNLPRFFALPLELCPEGLQCFVFLSSILHGHIDALFSGMTVTGCYQFRVTRNSVLVLDEEDDVKNRLTHLQTELQQRYYGRAVRLEVASECPDNLVNFLCEQFELIDTDVYRVNGPVNLARLAEFPEKIQRPDLRFLPFTPAIAPELTKQTNLFSAILAGDILLHHPYQSFQPVIDLLYAAANDEAVVGIKMTVYRTGTDSILMSALIAAAKVGKQVTVVVELMARFDEEVNMGWAAALEDVGAHVIYGIPGYKVHAKMLIIVRREAIHLQHYVHISTGNYHPKTAQFYTDWGLMTANKAIAQDVNALFMQMTGVGQAATLQVLKHSPFTLETFLLAAIRQEAQQAKIGQRAHLIIKVNALLDATLIQALVLAGQAGVKIDLIVRGACAIRPQQAGVTDNIRVVAHVGRFLEHSRIYYFYNAGKEDLYLASADWMGRNLHRRVEICVPILEPKHKKRVYEEGLCTYLAQSTEAWALNAKGDYEAPISRGMSAQTSLLKKYTSPDEYAANL
ncbi:MAG: polyphosphate kinase 1 [Neisseriaceae bacterium]|nr:polyphosphate kinase 1 [Neisseriaceae bacterium]